MNGSEELLPRLLPGPCLGQVQSDSTGTRGDPGRDVDKFVPDRRGAGLAEPSRRQYPGGPGEVVGHDRGGQPGTVGSEVPRRQVRQGTVFQVRVHLLDNRMAAVGLVHDDGAHGFHGHGGEERVEPMGIEQGWLPVGCLRIRAPECGVPPVGREPGRPSSGRRKR